MIVVDAFMWSYERTAVQVRFAELASVIDHHIAVQGSVTFRGEPRERSELPPGALRPVVEHVVDLRGSNAWAREKCQRNAVAELADPNALIIVSDGDEIPHPDAIAQAVAEYGTIGPRTLPIDYRAWYANWRAPGAWQYPHAHKHQPTIGTLADYQKVDGANNARWRMPWPLCKARGWHLSNLGGADYVYDKFGQFSHAEVDTPETRNMERLEGLRARRRDCIDRFELEVTEDLPSTIGQFPGCVA